MKKNDESEREIEVREGEHVWKGRKWVRLKREESGLQSIEFQG